MNERRTNVTLMKVAVDARPLARPDTGIGRYTTSVLEHMIPSSDYQWLLFGLPATHPLAGLTGVHTLPLPTGKLRSTLQVLLQIGPMARDLGADLFWTPRHHLPLGLAPLPSMTTVHDLVAFERPETMPHLSRLLDVTWLPSSVARSTVVITPSNETQQAIIDRYPAHADKIIVTKLGGDHLPARGAFSSQPFFLFIGGSQPRKNLRCLLYAISSIPKTEAQTLDLRVVGHLGHDTKEFEGLVRDLGIRDRIIFEGPLDEQALATRLGACEFLVAPYLNEGFGIPVAEALHFGKPSIVSHRSPMATTAGNSALTIDPLVPATLARAIEQLQQSSGLRRQLAENATKRAAHFRWQTTAEKTLAAIDSCLQ